MSGGCRQCGDSSAGALERRYADQLVGGRHRMQCSPTILVSDDTIRGDYSVIIRHKNEDNRQMIWFRFNSETTNDEVLWKSSKADVFI